MNNEATPLFIFDLDGTCADVSERRHLVEGAKKDWDAFHAECVHDKPLWPVWFVFRAVVRAGADVKIFSGRSDKMRGETYNWLRGYGFPIDKTNVQMRPEGDHTPDDQLKRAWYEALSAEDKERLVGVFDDRNRLVAMWRSLGVMCFQVADGDF